MDTGITVLADEIVHAFALRAENQGAVHLVVDGVIGLRRAFVEPNRPDVLSFQLFQSTRDICDCAPQIPHTWDALPCRTPAAHVG